MIRASVQVIERGEVWKKLRQKIGKLGTEARVKVGVLASGAAHHVHADSGVQMVELAAIHEFGSPAAGIPERSFLRAAFRDKHDEMLAVCEKLARAILADKLDVKKALALLGLWGQTAVKKYITDGEVTPRLEESEAGRRTIARKGSSKTLVDTGQLVNSITWEVDGEAPGSEGGESEP